MSALTYARLGCEFDRFLYASIGDDHNGMPLTVLSALARLDVDPWDEASKLTQLPAQSAVTQLASRLSSLRHAPSVCPDPDRIAAPLIALLPRRHDGASPAHRVTRPPAPIRPLTIASILLSVLAYLIFMLLGNWLMDHLDEPGRIEPPASSVAAPNSSDPPPSSEAR
jgi:hypothetical protein